MPADNFEDENLKDLRFADDTEHMETHLNALNSESRKRGLKIHKGKTKYMTNYKKNNKEIRIKNEIIEDVDE